MTSATPPKPAFTIRRADWHVDGPELRRVRTEVFVVEQQVPASEEWDVIDESAIHVIAEDSEGGAIATGRIYEIEQGIGKIGRVAVMKPWRCRGVGKAITNDLVAIAKLNGWHTVKLHAQTHAMSVYLKVGFAAFGEEFLECNIPHYAMKMHLV